MHAKRSKPTKLCTSSWRRQSARAMQRKLLQQSASQVRKPSTTTIESSNSGSVRNQQAKYRFSNLHTVSMNRLATQGSGNAASNQLFNTRERPAQALA